MGVYCRALNNYLCYSYGFLIIVVVLRSPKLDSNSSGPYIIEPYYTVDPLKTPLRNPFKETLF